MPDGDGCRLISVNLNPGWKSQNPETSVNIEGSKKSKILYLTCKSCGRR